LAATDVRDETTDASSVVMHDESLARHWHEDDFWHAPCPAMDEHDIDSATSIADASSVAMHDESLARHWHEDDIWHAPCPAMDKHDVDSATSIGEDVLFFINIEMAPSASTTEAADSAAARHGEFSSVWRGRRGARTLVIARDVLRTSRSLNTLPVQNASLYDRIITIHVHVPFCSTKKRPKC
jgi:hypothetical protein